MFVLTEKRIPPPFLFPRWKYLVTVKTANDSKGRVAFSHTTIILTPLRKESRKRKKRGRK